MSKIQVNSKLLGLALVGVVFTQAFQNCGQLATFEAATSGNLSMGSAFGDTDHPSTTELAPPVQKVLTLNRVATANLVREIFTSTTTPVPILESMIQTWIGNRAAQFGGACNQYDTNSSVDCGDLSNANTSFYQDDNTLRESFHVQFCENTLAFDQAVTAVLEKINRTAATPDAASIGQIYQLFYRAEDPNPLVTNSLLDMDRALAVKSESEINRWRAVILQVCVSTGWQLL